MRKEKTLPCELSDAQKADLVARYFVSFRDVVPQWEQRLKDMKLSRVHLPCMCRKLTEQEKQILDLEEIKTWFFNRSQMDSPFRLIARTKVAIFDAVLQRVAEGLKVGESFDQASSPSLKKPKKCSKIFYVADKNPEIVYLDFTPKMRQGLKDAFALGGVTMAQIHDHIAANDEGEKPFAVKTVYWWFRENEKTRKVDKKLLQIFLDAAISLMEERMAAEPIITNQTNQSGYQRELRPVQ